MKFPILDPNLVRAELGIDKADLIIPTVFLESTKEGPALVCDEGVGWFFDEDEKSLIVTAGSSYKITLEQAKRCLSENSISLRDFIGTYNDRYLKNLYLWEGMVELESA